MNPARVAVVKSSDPSWPRWGVVSDHHVTQWERSEKRAMEVAIERLGGPSVPHVISRLDDGHYEVLAYVL